MVGFRQSTQAFNAHDGAVVPLMLWFDDPIDALVDPLMMEVRKMLGEDVTS